MDDPAEPALVLSGPVTVETVGELRGRLVQRLTDGPAATWALDGAGVTQLDAAGAQLLYAFVVETGRRGGATTWVNASVYLVEAAQMLGMATCLGLSGLSPEVSSWRP